MIVMYNKNRKWRNHKRGLPRIKYVDTSSLGKSYRCVFFIGYSLLLKIIANAIIKATAMIVICIKEKNNMYITVIKYDVSIISLTFFWRQTTSVYSHFLQYTIYNRFMEKSIFFYKKMFAKLNKGIFNE